MTSPISQPPDVNQEPLYSSSESNNLVENSSPENTDSYYGYSTPVLGSIENAIPKSVSGFAQSVAEPVTRLFGAPIGNFGSLLGTRSQGVLQSQQDYNSEADWRVKLSLAPGANYLYNVASDGDVLSPLSATNGVVFPYTPQISVSYRANYDPTDITHSNYKLFFYRNSAVDDIQIVADFTAQDTGEASYVLAVIHFFKTVTKMFYGQDGNPTAGTPPPLCYISGLGQYQFNNHPLLVTNFQYALPNDVDYIRAGSTVQYAGQNLRSYSSKAPVVGFLDAILSRLRGSGLNRGGMSGAPKFSSLANSEATYVPTKIQLTINCVPVVSRNDITNNFSVEQYATGSLIQKGIW